MDKLSFGSLNSPDFWCSSTSPSIWTFLSLSRFMKLGISGMAWRHSQWPNTGPDPVQSQPGATVSLWLFLPALPYTLELHLYCWTLLLQGFLAQTIPLWGRLSTTTLHSTNLLFLLFCAVFQLKATDIMPELCHSPPDSFIACYWENHRCLGGCTATQDSDGRGSQMRYSLVCAFWEQTL